MKLVNLILVAVFAAGPVVQAEENGFTFEDSIRQQVFLELKSNVEHLYENSQLVVPAVDTSESSRVVSIQSDSGFVLPVSAAPEISDDTGSPAGINPASIN